ncbi:MAG: hypothetical protein ICV78_26870 [Tolypothrix sp. Co-bin9]|nr:hypothetical protein [Tolypothrix sp. Co-bin9]
MLTFAQVNFGLNLAGLIGIIYVLLAIVYFILTVAWLTQRGTRLTGWALVLSIIQVIFTPIISLYQPVFSKFPVKFLCSNKYRQNFGLSVANTYSLTQFNT